MSQCEAQEDAYGSALDIGSQILSLSDARLSPAFSNTSVNSAVQCPDGLDSSYGDSFLLDDINFPEHSSAASAQHQYSTSPDNSAVLERTPSSLEGSSSSDQPLTHAGSITSNGQGCYNLGPCPPKGGPCSPSGKIAVGWLSPLHIAAQKGHNRIARILLQHIIDCNEKDSDGLTPIMHAIIGGHEDVVRSLLSYGARLGDVDGLQRPSALHYAVLHRRETLLRVLLNHCVDERALIDSYDDFGRTPLHIAIDTDFETGVLLLLQFGANPQYKACKS